MKLFYYKSPDGTSNFGDDLNLWLWKQLLPEILDDDENTAFVGIGTLLNSKINYRLQEASKIVVFSSGVGYGTGPKIDDSWTIYCLRGPLSAQAINVSPELGVADGALLVRRLFNPTGSKVNRFAYMPHFQQARCGSQAWRSICSQIGFGYIDPRWPTEQVLSSISQTEILLAEAMHGAIIAEALRVPWIPIRTSSNILSFKWQDWCLSIGVEYQPRDVVRVFDLPEGKHIRSLVNYWARTSIAATQLAYIARTSRPSLSDDIRIEQLTVELEQRLQKFKDDVAKGYFHA